MLLHTFAFPTLCKKKLFCMKKRINMLLETSVCQVLLVNSKGLFCPHTSKTKETQTRVCHKGSRDLFNEIISNPETQVS